MDSNNSSFGYDHVNILSRVKLLPRQLGRGLLHCPLLRHCAREAPWSKYPVLQVKFTTSFKLNSLPLVIPWVGFPGCPHVIAVRRKIGRLASKEKVIDQVTQLQSAIQTPSVSMLSCFWNNRKIGVTENINKSVPR